MANYIDQMEAVLRKVPYGVWERVIGKTVDKVDVSRLYNPDFRSVGNQLHVFVQAGCETYTFERMDTMDGVSVDLARLWKPYRDVLKQFMNELKDILVEHPQYMKPKVTRREFDVRLDAFCDHWHYAKQLFVFIHLLGLKDILGERCYRRDYGDKSIETVLQDEARNILFQIVKCAATRSDNNELIRLLKELKVKDAESHITEIDELKDFCKETINVDESDKSYEGLMCFRLWIFMDQTNSVKELYEQAERTVEGAFQICDPLEAEYSYALGLDEVVREEILSFRDTGDNTRYWHGFRRGYFNIMIRSYYKDPSTLEKQLQNQDESPVLKRLYDRILETRDDYMTEMEKSFEDYQVSEYTETDINGEKIFHVHLPEYDIKTQGKNKEDVFKFAKEQLQTFRPGDLIRRLLGIRIVD